MVKMMLDLVFSLQSTVTEVLSPVCIEASALEQTLRVQKIVEEHNGSDFVFADTPNEKEELWKIRKEAFWSALILKPGAEAAVTVSIYCILHKSHFFAK
jgi:FAD/FMN-containing dehydrogenase